MMRMYQHWGEALAAILTIVNIGAGIILIRDFYNWNKYYAIPEIKRLRKLYNEIIESNE